MTDGAIPFAESSVPSTACRGKKEKNVPKGDLEARRCLDGVF